jgi:hypothetical protein
MESETTTNIKKPSSKFTEKDIFLQSKTTSLLKYSNNTYSVSKICYRENSITFPKIRGINMVRTRLLNNCLVGKVTPTPLATNFVMENGI